MKYLIIIFLTLLLIYLLSFARYNWTNNNRLAAVGSLIIGLAAVILPLYIMFLGNYEL